MSDIERRRFKRVQAPVLSRPLGAALVEDRRAVGDISTGGVRVYTDDEHTQGEHLELELFLPDGNTVTLDTLIVWIDALPDAKPAKYEVGLRFVDIATADLERIQKVLADAE
jgi:c-di-GMP-binding flagellar brake protein YcgR